MSPMAMPPVWQSELIGFCQKLIREPSLSGEEGEVAALVRAEMGRLHYDEVWVDEVGNVIGRMKGTGGTSILFNSHMDQVDIGDVSEWSHDPFGGQIVAGAIWGRGASDTKGAIATQVHAIGRIKESGMQLPGDIYVACVVHEETGSWGTQHLLGHLKAGVAVLGEATSNQIAIGHRGRTEIIITLIGQAIHASSARRDANLLFALARFLSKLEHMEFGFDQKFGSAALTPTRCYIDHASGNMTPGMVCLHLDWRSLPGDQLEELLNTLESILSQTCPSGITNSVELLSREVRSYTGMTTTLSATAPAYFLAEDHPLPRFARQVLEETLGRNVEFTLWNFATDGGYLTNAGIPTIGFSPGEERYAHTTCDQVRIDLMIEAFWGYFTLAKELPRLLE